MRHPKIAIEQLCKSIEGNKSAFDFLFKSFPELAMLSEYINGNESSAKWLKQNNQLLILAAAEAIMDDDKTAIKYLMENKGQHWAAVAAASEKKEEAVAWLKRFKLDEYLELAETLRAKWGDNDSNFFKSIFSSPIK